ncbi:MAG: glycosyltransferase family 4 protein [Bacteroidales bacterium]|nr:glycosyltransferase family 4 protein [Bacteroidales bacterium]
MNILIITNKLPYPLKDGGAIATLSLAYSLSEFAQKIDILTINTSKHFFKVTDIPDKYTQKINFVDYYLNTDINKVDLVKNFLFSKLPYNAQRFINEGFKQKIIEVLNHNSYDIIQFEGLYVLPYLDVIRSYSDAKISYRAHNIEHEIWERTTKNTNNKIKKIYLKSLTKRLKKFEQSFVNQYNFIVPITQRDENKLKAMGNTKPALTTPTGVDINNYKSDDYTCDENSIFHIGSLDWSPNQEAILWFLDNCWDKISEQNPKVKFYIAGRNAPQWLIKKVDKKNVEFVGEVEDAHQFIKSKSVMIVPLLSGSGMRIKIIEGMALSKAIITTSIGIEGISAADKKEVIVANTPQEFIESVNYLFTNKKQINEIGKNAKVFVSEKFDNFAIAKRLFDFYSKQLINNDL